MDDNTLLKIVDLSKNFGGIRAVTSFNLEVQRGDIHCLIGPNGAGKTTVFKMITGVYKPSSGQIFYKGRDITFMTPSNRARSGIGIKMQIPGVFGDLSLRDNLRIAIANYLPKKATIQERESKIDQLVERVKIKELGDPLVKNMTHGQQQWLEIAMALASDPELLLLDELAAGFGPEETMFTAELVKELNHQGLTILFIDHDMDFVRQIAKRVTVMHNGKLFAAGTMDEISHNRDVIKIYLGKS